MLRVCGVTYAFTTNYGSCLQAYALQKAVENQQVGQGERCKYEMLPTGKLQGYFFQKRTIKQRIKHVFFWVQRKAFSPFEEAHREYADCRKISELSELNEQFDAFVCGSDVIWNPDFNLGHDLFFLSFAKKYAFSYAASFGKANLTPEYLATLRERLSNLQQISVREPSAAAVVEKYSPYTATVIADPVLLLTREEWDTIIAPSKRKGDYIFVYVTHMNKRMKSFIKEIKRQTGLPVVWTVFDNIKTALIHKPLPPTPSRWLRLLLDAKYVVTNSFHATVFAALYHKTFFTVVGGKRNEGINIRMNEFLSSIGLEERIIDDIPKVINLSAPSFVRSDETIDSLRTEALRFLRENLEAAYQEKLARTQA